MRLGIFGICSVVIGLGFQFSAAEAVTVKQPTARTKQVVGRPLSLPFAAANSLAGHGQYKQAIEKYKVALEKEPHNAAIHHMYGRTMALMGLLPNAIDEYRWALKLQPVINAELENDIGVALAANDEPAEAAVHLRKAVQKSSQFIAAYNNLGVALTRLGDYRAASEAFQASLKMQPTNKYIVRKLAETSARLGESKHFDYTMGKSPIPASDGSVGATAEVATPTPQAKAPFVINRPAVQQDVETPPPAAAPISVLKPLSPEAGGSASAPVAGVSTSIKSTQTNSNNTLNSSSTTTTTTTTTPVSNTVSPAATTPAATTPAATTPAATTPAAATPAAATPAAATPAAATPDAATPAATTPAATTPAAATPESTPNPVLDASVTSQNGIND